MNNWLRWLAIVPVSAIAWFSVFVIGTFTHSYFQGVLCPPDDMISGFCTNEAVREKVNLLVPLFSGFSAVAVVLTAAAIAPVAKTKTAWGALLVGSIVALLMGGLSAESLSAIVLGTFSAIVVTKLYRSGPNLAVKRDAPQAARPLP